MTEMCKGSNAAFQEYLEKKQKQEKQQQGQKDEKVYG